MKKEGQVKLLAVASAGGHWVQLRRLDLAFAGAHVRYMSTMRSLAPMVAPAHLYTVRDASLREVPGLLLCALQILFALLRYRPDVVISTGAAPGFLALVFGKCLGARTIWIDSVANSEELSLSGKKVRPWADHWLTQWPDLTAPNGPHYIGSVL